MLEVTAQAKDKVDRGFLLDVVFSEGSIVLQLVAWLVRGEGGECEGKWWSDVKRARRGKGAMGE